MLEALKSFFKKNIWKVLIPIMAGIVIYLTPASYDWVDKIIYNVMEAMGLKPYHIIEDTESE